MKRALPALLVLGGCASAPPDAARVAAFSANAQFCGQSGTPICEARVNGIDGRPVLSGDAVSVAPGRRRLGVHCRMNLSIMIGDAQSFQRELTVELAPSARYRIEASMSPRPCSVALIDAATGRIVSTSD
ncbi:MAG: hypothetical protein OEW94_15600 [Betaproteobacteria bacterium]|nr:hypothetical protein [Betaproteobacteria bacterium]